MHQFESKVSPNETDKSSLDAAQTFVKPVVVSMLARDALNLAKEYAQTRKVDSESFTDAQNELVQKLENMHASIQRAELEECNENVKQIVAQHMTSAVNHSDVIKAGEAVFADAFDIDADTLSSFLHDKKKDNVLDGKLCRALGSLALQTEPRG